MSLTQSLTLLAAYLLLLGAVACFYAALHPHTVHAVRRQFRNTGTRVKTAAPPAPHTPRHEGSVTPAYVEIVKRHQPKHTGGHPIIRDEALAA